MPMIFFREIEVIVGEMCLPSLTALDIYKVYGCAANYGLRLNKALVPAFVPFESIAIR